MFWAREHVDTAQAMNDLGNALSFLGGAREAEQLDRQSARDSASPFRKRRSGDPEIDEQPRGGHGAGRRYREAEELQQTVLQAERADSRTGKPRTLLSTANLGDTLSREGKYRDAEKLKRDALEIRRRLLGADHPDTLHALSRLATTLYDQGRYAEAEVLDLEASDTRRRVSGS